MDLVLPPPPPPPLVVSFKLASFHIDVAKYQTNAAWQFRQSKRKGPNPPPPHPKYSRSCRLRIVHRSDVGPPFRHIHLTRVLTLRRSCEFDGWMGRARGTFS
jgi:hypothetical protein